MTSDFSLAKIGGSLEIADLVLVHGLTGDMIATWTSPGVEKDIGTYWPKWLFQDLPQLDVYALNFPTHVLESWAKGEMALYERGKASLDYLASFGLGSRPLAFITHSLGGLLVKQMIRTGIEASDGKWRGVA